MQGLVTVFGGSGFIGVQVTRALARAGYRVRVAVRRPGLGYKLPLMGDVGQIEVTQANVRNPASIARALKGAEACVNLVGILYESGRQGFLGVHAKGAEEIASACAAAGITRMVQMSALGADTQSPAKYARTKGEGEAAVRKALPSAVILRPSVVFGVDDQLFNRFAGLASMAPVVPLPGGGATRFQPVFVGDVAEAVANAISDPDAAGKTFELGGPQVYSYKQLIQMTLAEIQKSRPTPSLAWPLAKLIGAIGDVQAKLLPFPPVLTSDQVLMLQTDNVVAPDALGLKALGVNTPVAVEAIIPTYLYRYRRGGQFAQSPVISSHIA
ncbi:MAG TPA: complex I NDUFA9 subunit family protein [Caulobacteraceae bacterium]|nr:complex I NDUFA9 subunit family protein [Caulobacteraceae bacterium]